MNSTTKELSFCHINARSILAYNNESKSNQEKMDEIRQILCKQYEYSVIAVTETWLTPDTLSNDADLIVENYTFYRKDRNNGRGGGVGFYVADSWHCSVPLILRQTMLSFFGLKSRRIINVYSRVFAIGHHAS